MLGNNDVTKYMENQSITK